MKYTISINQKAVCDAGFNLDIVDMAIFDMLTTYTNSTACRRMNEGAKTFFNVPYAVVIDELPLCKITKPDSVYRRFQKLEMSGIINMHPENKKMKQVWFAWGRNYDRLHFGKQTGSKSGQPEKSGVRPDENPVQTGLESVLRPDENPPHNNTIPFTSPLSESEHAHAQTENSADLKTKDQPLSKRPGAPELLTDVIAQAESWMAENPEQRRVWVEIARFTGDIKQEVAKFFSHYWRETGQHHKCRTEPIQFFCDGFPGWLINAKTFNRPAQTPGTYASTTPEPRGAAYQPFPKYDY